MKIQYSLLAAVLAAGLLSAPAFAGSVNVNGGDPINVKVVDNSKDKSSVTVTGTLTITGCEGVAEGLSNGKTIYNSTIGAPTATVATVPSLAAQMVKAAQAAVDARGQQCQANGGRGSYYGSTVSGGISEFDNRTYTMKSSSSPDAILIGDFDNIGNAYSAQGTTSRYMQVDGDYGKTAVYSVNGSGYVSPIVLDLDGDGKIEASNGKYLPHSADASTSKNAVMFDFHGTGFPVVMEWVGANDGLLCRPLEDGTVNGTCLFGVANGHENGYEELASLDADNNGTLEAAELNGLMVWSDKNRNGIAEDGELASLESLGITSIGVNHNNFVGSFTRNGKTFKTFDWWPCVVDCRKVQTARNI